MALSEQGPDALESGSWKQRISRGTEVEALFDEDMRPRGFHLIEQRPIRRKDLDDRHFPDIVVRELPGALWQVKDGRRSGEWADVIAESNSLISCARASEDGWTVFVVWLMPDGQFEGNEINNLRVSGYISKEARTHGSGTPGTKISKDSLVPLGDLLRHP